MSVVCMREGTVLSAAAWCDRLEVTRDDVNLMVTAGVLRPRRGEAFAVEFVGIVVFANCCLQVCPKYISPQDFDLARMLSVLRGYFSRSSSRTPFEDQFRFPEFSDVEVLREFDAVVALREWFALHGLYRQEVEKRSTIGRPNWARTVVRQSPLITEGSVLYPAVESERRHDAFNDITALQVGLMLTLSKRYGLSISEGLRSATLAAGASIDSWPLAPTVQQFLQKRVLAEKRVQFRSDNLRLLTLLEQILGSRLATRNRKVEIFGTTAFYSVWEDGCRILFGGMDKPSDALGQPAWRCTVDQEEVVDQLEQLPDIVIARGKELFILDAKYYFPFFQSKPGAPDIIKQIYYAEAVADGSWSSVRSLFILPMNGAWSPKYLGSATIEGSARKFPAVEAWGIEPKAVFAHYPNAPRAAGASEDSLFQRPEAWSVD